MRATNQGSVSRPRVRAKPKPQPKPGGVIGAVTTTVAKTPKPKPAPAPRTAARAVSKAGAKKVGKHPYGAGAKTKPVKGVRGRGKANVKGGGLAALSLAGVTRGIEKNIKPGDFYRAGFQPVLGAIADSGVVHAVSQTGTNLGKDAIDLAANAIPSAYYVGKQVADGHPEKAAKMLAQPYVDAVEHPLKSLKDHPLQTALLFSGAEGAVGHGVGKALRVAPSKALRKAGSTARPAADRVVPGTGLRVEGRYSKDSIKKGAQVASDKARGRKAGKPATMTNRQIKRRLDTRVAVNEDVRRVNRTLTDRQARTALGNEPGLRAHLRLRKPPKPTAAVTLTAQNAIDGTLADLKAYRAEVAANRPKGAADVRRHEDTLKLLDEAIAKHDEQAVKVAAERMKAESVRVQERLAKTGLVDKAQAERARLMPYALRKMGAVYDKKRGLLLHDEPLSTEAIRAHMKQHGVTEPAFVTHAPNSRGARNYYVSQMEPPRAVKRGRTGESLRTGTADLHPETMVESNVRAQGLVDAAHGYQSVLREAAVRGKSGKTKVYASYDHAVKAAEDMAVSHGVAFRPVRVVPFQSSKALTDAMLHGIDQTANFKTISEQLQNAIAEHPSDKSGQWALVPEATARQLADHIHKTNAMGPVGKMWGSAFRTTVLATNPKWLVGNDVEAALRAGVAHAGPRSYVTGRAVLKRLDKQDPALAREVRATTVGGGHYTQQFRLNRKVTPTSFDGRAQTAAARIGQVGHAPGVKQVRQAWHAYTQFVFHTLNGRVESQFQTAMLGKALRDHPLMNDRVVKLSQKAFDDYANGIRDPNVAVQLGREIETMYGKYNGFSPQMRNLVAGYTPFIAWSLNAIKFVGLVLPRDHPVLTSLLVAANQASEDWRRQHGLVMGEKGAAPAWLQGSIPGSDGAHLRISRYTPFGAFDEGGSAAGTLASNLLPQGMAIYRALVDGTDWKGKNLVDAGEAPPDVRIAAATDAFLGSVIPLYAQTQKTAENHGDPSSALNPFAWVPPRKPSGKRKVKKKSPSSTGYGPSPQGGAGPSNPYLG